VEQKSSAIVSTDRRVVHCPTTFGIKTLSDVVVQIDDNVKEITSLSCWELILAGIRRHCSVSKLVTNGCLALAAIVEADGKMLNFISSEQLVFTKAGSE